MRTAIFIIFGLALAASVSAQEPRADAGLAYRIFGFESPRADVPEDEEPVETDRDSFTPATRVAGRGRSIFESAYSFIENRRNFETHSYPEILYRYGLTRRVEVRLGWNLEVGGGSSAVSGLEGLEGLEGGGIERETRVLYGLKAQVSEQQGWIPNSVFVVQAQTPTSGRETDTQALLDYALGYQLANRWKLDASLRYGTASAGQDRFIIWAPSAVLRVPLGDRWAVHGEYFGLFAQQSESNFVKQYFSPGVHYLLTRDLEVGVRLGWGLNDQSSPFFANVGLGWRF